MESFIECKKLATKLLNEQQLNFFLCKNLSKEGLERCLQIATDEGNTKIVELLTEKLTKFLRVQNEQKTN